MSASKILCTLFFLIVSVGFAQNKEKKNDCIKIVNSRFPLATTISNSTSGGKACIEARFHCIRGAMSMGKAIFDKYGKWSVATPGLFTQRYFLVWENIDLYNNGVLYNLITFGDENQKEMYTSIMIFDKDYNDLLADDAENYDLVVYFTQLLNINDPKKKEFYEPYWTTVNPKRWKEIQKRRSY